MLTREQIESFPLNRHLTDLFGDAWPEELKALCSMALASLEAQPGEGLALRQDERDYLADKLTCAKNSLRIEEEMEPGSHRACHALRCEIKALEYALGKRPGEASPLDEVLDKTLSMTPSLVIAALHSRVKELEGELTDAKSLIEDIRELCKAQGITLRVFQCKNAGGPTP